MVLREETSSGLATFGRRKMAARICVVARKPHVRSLLCESFEEFGLLTCECGAIDGLAGTLDIEAPDVVVVGIAADSIDPVTVLACLAAEHFAGRVLLIGNPDLTAVAAIHERGADLGLTMLPTLATPYRQGELRERLSAVLPVEPTPPPPVDVAQALHEGWFELWYQPKIEIRSLTLCGVEALIRMRHPSWGIVPPAYFIPDDGDPHFRALSEFVIARAMADWRYFVDGYAAVELAVNLPLAFLRDSAMRDELRHRMPAHPAFRGMIVEINVTEVIRDIGYEQDGSVFALAGLATNDTSGAPVLNEATMESSVPGIYVVGTASAGTQDHFGVFIENSHQHADRVAAALAGRPAPAPVPPRPLPEM